MKRWLYYHWLAATDLIRLASTTQHHVIIVSGICLPILLLLGLKHGHVAELRKDLVTSPTGRQVVFWSAQRGELMKRETLERLKTDLPGVDLIVPELQRVVDLATGPALRPARQADGVTLFATRPGDPVLAKAGGDVLTAGEHAIVLIRKLADDLHVKAGDSVVVTGSRGRGPGRERASAQLRVKAVVSSGTQEGRVGYVDVGILDALEQYVRGFRVQEFRWPAHRASARDTYAGYLIFCERANNLTDADREILRERGLTLAAIDLEQHQTLSRLFVPEKRKALHVWFLASDFSRADPSRRLSIPPSELAQLTEADDVVLPWNEPIEIRPANEKTSLKIVGLSLSSRNWLRSYFVEPELAFDYEADPFSIRFAEPSRSTKTGVLVVGEGPKTSVEFKLSDYRRNANPAHPTGPQANEPLGVVPTNVLALFTAARAGLVTYDPDVRLFVPNPEPPVYDKARLYARGIDEVPRVVEELRKRHFAVMSESARIHEIQLQDRSLQLLVVIVGVGVFLFGVIVVVSVLLDATDRKRGTIGILRVMGVSGPGVFYVVILRATAIGVLAGALSVFVGHLIALGLAWNPPAGSWLEEWKPVVRLIVDREAILIVGLGALTCCAVGALIPAWRASRLDPFDAIVEGRFH